MSKKLEYIQPAGDAETFEIIETTIDNVDLLTRAFDLIAEVCDELNHPEVNLDPDRPKLLMH